MTPSQTVPSLLHLVTQWMSTVILVCGSAWNASQLHFPARDPPSCRARVHFSSGVRGVGPALRTGKSSVTYWPGGTRFPSALARGRPVKPRLVVCELVEYFLEDIDLKGAWTGPAALSLTSHALAPLAELPVLEVVSATHIIADLTLALGKVVHDYLA